MEIEPEAVPAPPVLSLDATEELNARTPLSWIRDALRQNTGAEVWHLVVAWIAFTGLTGTTWALHLRRFAGWSALPNHWGDRLSARDVWELAENGGWRQNPVGGLTLVMAILSLLWVLWAGWRLQARVVDLPHRLGPWLWGLVDALLIGAVPLLLPCILSLAILEWLGTWGLQGMGWMRLVLSPLLQATTVSAFMLQWWFCRLGRAYGAFEHPSEYARHLGHSFLRLWMHPVQWLLLLLGSAALRATLGFGALLIGWRWGGGTPTRVWGFLVLELIASALAAWILGAQLRISALFWNRDRRVREARRQLHAECSPGALT